MKKDLIYGIVVTVLLSLISAGFIPTKAQVLEIVDNKTATTIKELKVYIDERFTQQEKLLREIIKNKA